MEMSIFPIPLGFDQCYLIKGDGIIMIDGGAPRKAKDFNKEIKKVAVKSEEIQLIILTHGHWDHIASAKDIKEITGAKITMHKNEKDWLEKSLKSLPPGATPWGRILINTLAMFMPAVHIPATTVDIVLGNEGMSLDEYGISGRIVHTPGHSSGSVSVLLKTGDAFVGDLAMNRFPLRLSPGLPILAEDFQTVKESWKLLLDQGAKTIYPAHGKPFSADVIQKVLS